MRHVTDGADRENLEDGTECSEIRQKIAVGEEVGIVLHTLTELTEKRIRFILQSVLENYRKAHLFDSVFGMLFEIVVNGARANFKRIFFEERGLDIFNPDDYANGMALFKQEIGGKMLTVYGDKSRDKGKEVRITFKHGKNGMSVEVQNNTEILPVEEERIRANLAHGLKHENLFSFYSSNHDQSEGEGLGLVLSLLLLKAENLDPSLFQIGTKPGVTFARIEIPFS